MTATTYTKSAVGKYKVTFDIAEAEGWNAASGLAARVLVINPPSVVSVTYDTLAADRLPEEKGCGDINSIIKEVGKYVIPDLST